MDWVWTVKAENSAVEIPLRSIGLCPATSIPTTPWYRLETANNLREDRVTNAGESYDRRLTGKRGWLLQT